MIKNTLFILVLSASPFLGCSPGEQDHNIFSQLTFHQPEGFTDSLLVGTLEVFENRETREGSKIPLFVGVTPALIRDSLLEPIFIVDGGPGIAASNQSYFYTQIDTNYRRYHDIVYIDVRGTGKSRPLHCLELQTKSSPQDYFDNPYPREKLEACIDRYRDSVDFNCYRSTYIVDDMEDVRQWLGYDKINLMGLSFGGKVSLMYMDRYPSSTHRVVLHAPDAPNIDYVSKRGRYSQRALNELFDFCARDSFCRTSYPDIRSEFDALMLRLQNEVITEEVTSNDSTFILELSWPPVAAKIANMLYHDAGYIQIPYIVHEAFLKNYHPLLEAMNVTNGETDYFFADGMWLSNICSEDIPQVSRIDDDKEKASFLSDYTFSTRSQACKDWPVNKADSSAYNAVVSDIPTLLLSGHFDPAIPPETGAEIVKTLSNGQQIVIPYMAHMLFDLTNIECYDQYVLAYFDNSHSQLKPDCFQEMKPQPFKLPPAEPE